MKIEINRNAKTTSTDFSWQMGLGNDHAAQLLRKDVIEHIKLAHDELGIKYIRCHGIFDDDMLTYLRLSDSAQMAMLPGAKNIGKINFHTVSVALDNLLSTGVKPFLELSFMPTALASGKKKGFLNGRYDNNITMPKSLDAWASYIENFVSFLKAYYGEKEIEQWYFEVWNEPDLGGVFFKGKQQDYFKLYETTSKSIKKVDPKLRVGGPATSVCKWIKEFVAFCKGNNVPLDFVSTHHYPGDGFGNMFTIKDLKRMMNGAKEMGKKKAPIPEAYKAMFFNPEAYKSWERGRLHNYDEQAIKDADGTTLFIDEWSSMAVFGSPVHDEKYEAAFIIDTAMRLENKIPGYMYWCCSDVFEELLPVQEAFHGSYGVVSISGIPKPNFWAFKILSSLYKERIEMPLEYGAVECAAFKNGEKAQILLFDQEHDYYKHDTNELEVEISGPCQKAFVYRIDDNHCNPKGLWIKMGQKDILNPKEVAEIKEGSYLVKEEIPFEIKNGQSIVKLSLGSNDVILVSLE